LAVEELRRDHEILARDVAALEATVNRLSESPLARKEALSGTLRGSLTDFGATMERHFRREEEAVFPDARRLVSEGVHGAELISQFLSEEAEDDLNAHTGLRIRMTEMIRLLDEAEAAGELDEQQSSRLRTLFSHFRGVLVLHAAKEDDLIFPVIHGALTPSERNAALSRLASIPLERPTYSLDAEA
jgi:hemerythrin-like domain-containing protein